MRESFRSSILIVIGILAVSLGFSVSIASAVPIDKLVTVQPIQVCQEAPIPPSLVINCAPVFSVAPGSGLSGDPYWATETKKIYAQGGMDITFLPLNQINSDDFFDLNTEAEILGLWNSPTNSANTTPNVINMWFVATLFDELINPPAGTTLNGVTNSLNPGQITIGRQTFVVNRAIQTGLDFCDPATFGTVRGFPDVIAHELGHSFGLVHISGAGNLMTDAGRQSPCQTSDIAPDGLALDLLSSDEIATIRSSPFAIALNGGTPGAEVIPEPGTMFLLGSGLAGLVAWRRLTKA